MDTLLPGEEDKLQSMKFYCQVQPPNNKWDYILVFALTQRPYADTIIQRILDRGFLVKECMSRDQDEIFVYISATLSKFENLAEKFGVKKQLRPEYGGALAEYKQSDKSKFVGADSMNSFFTSYERAMMLHFMLTSRGRVGGVELNLKADIASGRLSQCFPLHEEPIRKQLIQTWVREWHKPQPIDAVRSYYGEYIAIYFSWLEHYTKWLSIPAATGLLLIIAVGLAGSFDNHGVPFYCLFLGLWATFYLEMWKRRNSEIVADWNTTNLQAVEFPRASFRGELAAGVYVENEFVPLEPDPDNGFNPPKSFYSPESERHQKNFAGASLLTTFLVVVIVATFGIMAFRIFLRSKIGDLGGGIIVGCVNSMFIMTMNQVYRRVAMWLTEWENYRTDSEFENAFIIKNFVFQFVNSYISLFYIAFLKGHIDVFGKADKSNTGDLMTTLAIQLGTIFLTSIFYGQFNEVAWPYFSGKLRMYLEDRKMQQISTSEAKATQAERESKLAVYATTYDDYNEMAIQWGYITLFAAAFPLAPLAALLNNVVEMRSDAFKLLEGMQRPHPRGAKDIGVWFEILEIISYVSVITNVCLVMFACHNNLFSDLSDVNKVIAAVVIEHAFFGLKWLLSISIPDVPKWVRLRRARQLFFRSWALNLEEEFTYDVREDEETGKPAPSGVSVNNSNVAYSNYTEKYPLLQS
mmetsp:Transcript_24137/g.33847  ORF Transcript_24137/g.33847 Transcript_24137/m.33847 type:complete len:693 (+) Transcript_24137:62-2140(+)